MIAVEGLLPVASAEKNGLVHKNVAYNSFNMPNYIDFPNMMSKLSLPYYFNCFISISANGTFPTLYLISKAGKAIHVKLIYNPNINSFNVKFKIDADGYLYMSKRFGGMSENIVPVLSTGQYSVVASVDISSLALTDITVE